jgi:hypothetical protein
MKKGRAGTMTHDYKRNGATTLFAAMNVLNGTVIGRNMQRHRHQEFIRFLNAVEREVPAGKTVHAILDNDAVHKHPATSTPRSENGWRAIRAGHSTSRRPRLPDSTPSRPSSRPSPSAVSSAASSNPWSICRPPSTASSTITTPSQSPSNGSLTAKKSSKPSIRHERLRMQPPIGDAVLVVAVLHQGKSPLRVPCLRRLSGSSLSAKTRYGESQSCFAEFAKTEGGLKRKRTPIAWPRSPDSTRQTILVPEG